jgi:DNA-binding MarR family transcriptional regulator
MRKGSLTSLIDSLVSMGLVRREADPSDRRRILINLTDEGEAYVKQREHGFEISLNRLLSSLPEKEVEGFKNSLKNVVDTMKKLGGNK